MAADRDRRRRFAGNAGLSGGEKEDLGLLEMGVIGRRDVSGGGPKHNGGQGGYSDGRCEGESGL